MNLKWNSKMLTAFYEIKKIDKNFKKIFDEFGLPENRAIEKKFESIVKIICSIACLHLKIVVCKIYPIRL